MAWPLIAGALSQAVKGLLPLAIGYSAYQMGSWSEGNKGQTDIISADRRAQLDFDWAELDWEMERYADQEEDEELEQAIDLYGDMAYRRSQGSQESARLQAQADESQKRRQDVESDRHRYLFGQAMATRSQNMGTLEETAYILSELYAIRERAMGIKAIRPNPESLEDFEYSSNYEDEDETSLFTL